MTGVDEKELEALIVFKAFHTEYYDYVVELIGKEKADIWFYTENPHLGNVSPVFLIMKGKSKKLISFIKNAISENKEIEK
jgi:hypothetical protein